MVCSLCLFLSSATMHCVTAVATININNCINDDSFVIYCLKFPNKRSR